MKTKVFVCALPPYLWIFSNLDAGWNVSHIHEISRLSGEQKKETTTFWEEWEPHLNKTCKWFEQMF